MKERKNRQKCVYRFEMFIKKEKVVVGRSTFVLCQIVFFVAIKKTIDEPKKNLKFSDYVWKSYSYSKFVYQVNRFNILFQKSTQNSFFAPLSLKFLQCYAGISCMMANFGLLWFSIEY